MEWGSMMDCHAHTHYPALIQWDRGFYYFKGNAPCTDGVGVDDLALAVLQQVGEGAMQDPRGALREGGSVLVSLHTLSARLHANEPDVLIVHKLVEQPCDAQPVSTLIPLHCKKLSTFVPLKKQVGNWHLGNFVFLLWEDRSEHRLTGEKLCFS